MPTYEYRNLRLNIPEQDTEYSGYFEAARDHKLVCKKCTSCGLMRGEPSHGCPFCPSYDWEWEEVSGKGTIYSYQIVAHTVMTGFKDFAPFAHSPGGTGRAEGPAHSRRRVENHRQPGGRQFRF